MAKTKQQGKRDRELLGKLVVDFANAKTTDEACLGVLDNIQRVFRDSFSPSAIEELKNRFPRSDSVPPPADFTEAEILQSIEEKIPGCVRIEVSTRNPLPGI